VRRAQEELREAERRMEQRSKALQRALRSPAAREGGAGRGIGGTGGGPGGPSGPLAACQGQPGDETGGGGAARRGEAGPSEGTYNTKFTIIVLIVIIYNNSIQNIAPPFHCSHSSLSKNHSAHSSRAAVLSAAAAPGLDPSGVAGLSLGLRSAALTEPRWLVRVQSQDGLCPVQCSLDRPKMSGEVVALCCSALTSADGVKQALGWPAGTWHPLVDAPGCCARLQLQACFTFSDFWATEARVGTGGLFTGNLRGGVEEVRAKLGPKLSEAAGVPVALFLPSTTSGESRYVPARAHLHVCGRGLDSRVCLCGRALLPCRGQAGTPGCLREVDWPGAGASRYAPAPGTPARLWLMGFQGSSDAAC